MSSNWRNRLRPAEKSAEQVGRISGATGKSIEDETVAARLVVAENVVLQKQFFGATELPPTSSLKLFGSQSEDFTNELNLAKHIPFRQPPHLAFSDHV